MISFPSPIVLGQSNQTISNKTLELRVHDFASESQQGAFKDYWRAHKHESSSHQLWFLKNFDAYPHSFLNLPDFGQWGDMGRPSWPNPSIPGVGHGCHGSQCTQHVCHNATTRIRFTASVVAVWAVGSVCDCCLPLESDGRQHPKKNMIFLSLDWFTGKLKPENPIFNEKIDGFRFRFSRLNQSIDSWKKSGVFIHCHEWLRQNVSCCVSF